MQMQVLASKVEDENQVVTVKSLAYDLDIPLSSAQALLGEYYQAGGPKLKAAWILLGQSQIVLASSENLAEEEKRLSPVLSKSIFSVEKSGGVQGSDSLNSALDQVRKKLIAEDTSDRLLHNRLGPVRYKDLHVLAHAAKPVFANDSLEEEDARPKPSTSTTTKTAADFFRSSSLSSQGSAGGKKSTASSATQPNVSRGGAGASAKKNVFGSFQKQFPAKDAMKEEQVSVSLATPKEVKQLVPDAIVVGDEEAGGGKFMSKPLFDEEEEQVISSDEEDGKESESSLSSSSDSEMENDDEETKVRNEAGKKRSSPTKAEKPSSKEGEARPSKKRTASSAEQTTDKKKTSRKSRVVVSDDEEEGPESREKREKREKRKAERMAEKQAEKQAEKEAKRRREIEEKEGAKLEFLRQLGAKQTNGSGVTRKKVLKTKTFIDEDGFEVTEDVMEEIEVLEDEEKQPEPQPTLTSKQIPKEKKAAPPPASTATKANSSGGRQSSLTSFFSKKQ